MQKNNLISIIKDGFIFPHQLLDIATEHWPIALDILRTNNLIARYGYRLKQENLLVELPRNVQKHFLSAVIAADRLNNQAIYEAELLVHHLSLINLQPIFLKGAAYSIANSEVAKGRRYTDIDILLDKNNLQKCATHLLNFGWLQKSLDEYDEKYYREWAHEIPPLHNRFRGTTIDAHHNIIPPISGKAPNINDFLIIENRNGYLVPSLTTQIIHSAVHLYNNEEFHNGFRDLTDLYLMFCQLNKESDWNNLLSQAWKTNFIPEVGFALRYCNRLLGLTIPSNIKQEIDSATNFNWLDDFVFDNVLVPFNKKLTSPLNKLAFALAYIRGHYIKMPLKILFLHFTHKITKEISSFLFGKHSFK